MLHVWGMQQHLVTRTHLVIYIIFFSVISYDIITVGLHIEFGELFTSESQH